MRFDPAWWQAWLVAAVALAILELKLGNFVLIWFAIASGITAILAALGLSFDLQLIAFSVASVALFAASRTLFRTLLFGRAPRMVHGTDALLGLEAVALEPITATTGSVRVHGEQWTARAVGVEIATGEVVEIERVDGLKLYVRKAQPLGLAPDHRIVKEKQ